MADKTGIEWTDATWNPIRGCTRVSEGCRHCYAEIQAARIIRMDRGRGVPEGQGSYDGTISKDNRWNGQIKIAENVIDQPLRWQKPRKIFVNSMSDLFHESVPDEAISQIFSVMQRSPQHTFQILTKRPDRMLAWFQRHGDNSELGWLTHNPLPNVWLGVSIEDQAAANTRIPLLLEIPAAVRWLSCEPLLGPVDLTDIQVPCPQGVNHYSCLECEVDPDDDPYGGTCIDWVVVGGESGKTARPMHLGWARSLRDQCANTEVPFLFKQLGEFTPNWFCNDNGEHDGSPIWMDRVGKKAAGRLLDGIEHNGYPRARS